MEIELNYYHQYCYRSLERSGYIKRASFREVVRYDPKQIVPSKNLDSSIYNRWVIILERFHRP